MVGRRRIRVSRQESHLYDTEEMLFGTGRMSNGEY
jgi:hypothetical protein